MKRGFFWTSKAWYAKSALEGRSGPDIMFGLYDGKDGWTTGQMAMRWHPLCGKMVPRLEVFNDGWNVLKGFKDVIDALALKNNDNISEGEFIDLLLRCGFEDLTPYKSPYDVETS